MIIGLIENKKLTNLAVTFASNQTRSSDQTCGQVGNDIAVQVGHHQHVKLLWLGHQLHTRVVHDHALELNVGVEL